MAANLLSASAAAATEVTRKLVEVEVHDRSWFRKGSLSIDTECFSDIQSFETPSTVAPNSPGSARSGFIGLTGSFGESVTDSERQPGWGLSLDSPTSCFGEAFEPEWFVDSLELQHGDFECISGKVSVILFDFDGTLTSVPGEKALGVCKQDDLLKRSTMLAPRLRALRVAGLSLGIISKSTSTTIQSALHAAGLADFFDGPIVAKAVGLKGKAGFIQELVRTGPLSHLGADGVRQVLLVDDDLSELEQALAEGIQTYPVSRKGGLQEEDFNAIWEAIGL